MAHAPDFEFPLPPDTLIGQWRLVEYVGGGAFGRVYKAVLAQVPDSEVYALKLARMPGDQRFAREAEMLVRVQHPSIPRLHSAGLHHDERGRSFPFLVMQFVYGEDLYEWAHKRPLTARTVMRLLAQVARALEATHRHGVHRDVKGTNIRVSHDGHVTLLDFGACWFPGARPLTHSAVPPGTEAYRSHQILRFRYQHRRNLGAHYRFQPQDDLFALGVMAYYLVTGLYPPPPTRSEGANDPLSPPLEPLQPPSEFVTLTPDLEQIILRLLSEEPRARGTAGALADEWEQKAVSWGLEADEAITPTFHYKPTERALPPGPPQPRFSRRWRRVREARAPLLLAAALSCLLVANSTVLDEKLAQPIGEKPLEKGADGEGVSLGSATLESDSPSPAEAEGGDPAQGVSGKVPSKPLKGQKRPPCGAGAVEIHKGCWVRAADLEPPCSQPGYYEWQGSCYGPVILPESVPTSDP